MGCSTCSASKLDSSFGTVLPFPLVTKMFQFFLLPSLKSTIFRTTFLVGRSLCRFRGRVAVDVRFEHLGLFPGIDLGLLCQLD
jgi:hypothetical protein